MKFFTINGVNGVRQTENRLERFFFKHLQNSVYVTDSKSLKTLKHKIGVAF